MTLREDPAALKSLNKSRPAPTNPYGPTFWSCYLANTALMVAISCTFRYADFVHLLGGTPFHLGLIIGIGTVGSLLIRVMQGVGMDRIGPRRMWLACLGCYILSMLLHPLIHDIEGPAVYLVRILSMIGVAGAFGASLTFVSQIAPPGRMGELLGMLGTSGFLGLAIGPALSDVLLGLDPTRADVNRMFHVAAAMGAAAWLTALWGTHGVPHPTTLRFSSWAAVRRYHPGTLLLVAAAMGLGLSLPGVFVRSFAREAELGGIGPFFLVYAATAFVVRVATRRLSDRIGVRPVVLTGLTLLSASMLVYLAVDSSWSLVLPAIVTGMAHALLFPAVLSGGNAAFPAHYRGLATTVTLSMFDIGNMLGQPLAGLSVQLGEQWGLPPYPTMFGLVAGLVFAANTLFLLFPPRPATIAEPTMPVSEPATVSC